MRSEGDGPSVTQVLELVSDFSNVPPGILAKAADRGTRVHDCCELYDQGMLDQAFLERDVEPYLKAWEAFHFAYEPEILEIEKTVQVYGMTPYHGRYDRLANVRQRAYILDIKTSAQPKPKLWACQLAGYRYALADSAGIAVVQLRKDGTFMFRDYTEHYQQALDIFQDLLRTWHSINNFNTWEMK